MEVLYDGLACKDDYEAVRSHHYISQSIPEPESWIEEGGVEFWFKADGIDETNYLFGM